MIDKLEQNFKSCVLVLVRTALKIKKVEITHGINIGTKSHARKVVAQSLRLFFIGGKTKCRDALEAAQRIDDI